MNVSLRGTIPEKTKSKAVSFLETIGSYRYAVVSVCSLCAALGFKLCPGLLGGANSLLI